jgi:hypothetical protein
MRPLRKCMRPSDMRMRPFDMCMRPSASVCAPQPAVYAWSNPDHPTWQRCGSHRGQSKSKFTLSKVNKTLTLIRRTRTLSDVTNERTDETDARTHRQPYLILNRGLPIAVRVGHLFLAQREKDRRLQNLLAPRLAPTPLKLASI